MPNIKETVTAQKMILDALVQVEADIDSNRIAWKMLEPPPQEPTARCFLGTIDDRQYVAVDFDIEPQGFPAGSRGYDGTYRRAMTIMRIPRVFAERLVKDAIEKGANA